MKLPSLKLESKVLLTAAAVCIFAILKMAHIVIMSERDDTSALLLIGFILAVIVLRENRNSSVANAVYFLCFGLYWCSRCTLGKSFVESIFLVGSVVLFGGGFLMSLCSAVKEYRNTKRKVTLEARTD
jgi:hypothetical protein